MPSDRAESPDNGRQTETVGIALPEGLLEEVDARAGQGNRSEWVRDAIELRVLIDGWYEERGEVPGMPSTNEIQQMKQALERMEELQGGSNE